MVWVFNMKKIIGIYKITSPSGKIYIGQSVNIFKRWQKYNQKLAEGQPMLNNSFKKYGLKNHEFEIIKECNKDELNKWEKYYIKLYNSYDTMHGLNLTKGGYSGGAKNFTDESREKIRQSLIGNKRAFKPNKKIKKKMFEHGKNGCKIVSSVKNNIIIKTYNSIKDASIDVGAHHNSISSVLTGSRKSCKGYKWIYGDVVKSVFDYKVISNFKHCSISDSDKKLICNNGYDIICDFPLKIKNKEDGIITEGNCAYEFLFLLQNINIH